jgi:hypothetical protein
LAEPRKRPPPRCLEAKVLRYLVWHIGSREKMVRLPQSRIYRCTSVDDVFFERRFSGNESDVVNDRKWPD